MVGYTVPTVLSSQLIDALRAASVVRRAGAITVPLTSDNQSIAKVASEPVRDFRLEAAELHKVKTLRKNDASIHIE